MNKRMTWTRALFALTILAASLAFAQKQPKPNSQKELDALRAWQSATDIDTRLKAIENVLTNFADTDFKEFLLEDAMQLEERKGDYAQTVFYAERLLDAEPNNAFALVTLAGETARHTREFDLDKEEKLAKVDKYAKAALDAAKQAPKPRPDIPDDQWENARKDLQAQAYEAMGMAAGLRKKYDEAIADYKQSLDISSTKDPATYVRMGQVYEDAGKYDEATASLDQAINFPNVNPQVKTIAQSKKDEVAKKKAAGQKPPGTP